MNANLKTFGLGPVEESTMLEVCIVECSAMELHGFSGLDRIYLNATYFNTKFQNNQKKAERKLMNESTGILDFIGQMEVIALSIHEFAHVCLRKVRHFKILTELRLP